MLAAAVVAAPVERLFLLTRTVLLVALAVVAEFGVDRWDSKLAAYGLMIACLVGLFELAGISRRISYQGTED